MNDIISSTTQMTSLEIDELVESQHGNVCISIERLAKRGVIQLPPMQKVENKQSTSPNNKVAIYTFSGEHGKRDSIVVVAQLSPEFTGRLVDRWQALESGEAVPAFRLEPRTQPIPRAEKLRVREIKETFGCFMAIAKLCKFDGNMAILSANQATQALTGTNPLALMGRTSLEAEGQDQLLIVSEIADRLEWSHRMINPRLTKAALQTEYRDHKKRLCYELTEMGLAFGVYVDTGKKHGDGAPVRQIKWRATVVDFLRDHYSIGEDAA